ncbi:hypothetical protein CspHIS471_0403090 [Cutaneotrichosporon sp. HIS471]|nr:hypothetical protein CspHIS471_0403090 [Cutaneotrichosporon sp. HIS471]
MLGVIPQFSVQMTGVSFLQSYAPKVYGKVECCVETRFLLGSLSGVPDIPAQFSCVVFVDRTGRRWPLMIGSFLSGFLYIWNTYISKMFQDGHGTLTQARAPVEIMNPPIRAKGAVRTSTACWIANFMIGQRLEVSGVKVTPDGRKWTITFEITHWFVPLARYEGIDAGARESELAAAGENGDDEKRIEHCESVRKHQWTSKRRVVVLQ